MGSASCVECIPPLDDGDAPTVYLWVCKFLTGRISFETLMRLLLSLRTKKRAEHICGRPLTG